MGKIGNLFFMLTSCAFITAQPQATLRICSAQGTALKAVTVGKPCKIELMVSGGAQIQGLPQIAGLDQAAIITTQQSNAIYVHEGHRKEEKKIEYIVRFKEPGTYQIGPARVITSQGALRAAPVTLEVRESVEPTSNETEVHWEVAQKPYYVGQAIKLKIRATFASEAVQGLQLHCAKPVGARLEIAPEPQQESGAFVWDAMLYPEQSGDLSLPQAALEYHEPQSAEHERSLFVGFMQMMGSFLVRKVVQLPTETIKIQELPPYPDHVMAVGTVTEVTATMSGSRLEADKPLIYTLKITGDLSKAGIKLPRIISGEVYKVHEPTEAEDACVYEYVIQGLRPGTAEIPSQKITFFNPERERYESWQTPTFVLESVVQEADQSSPAPVVKEEREKKKQEPHRPVPWTPLILALVCLVLLCVRNFYMLMLALCLLAGSLWYEYRYQCVVTKSQELLYLGPDQSYPVCARVGAHERVSIVARRGDWLKIKKETMVGWISADKVS